MTKEAEHNCRNDDKLSADVEKFGWSVILVYGTDYLPSFAYTIGLWKTYNHPEVIAFGLNAETMHIILNDIGGLVKAGQTIQINKNYPELFEEAKAEFIVVDQRNLNNYFGTAIDFYNTENFPALELIWTDRNDKFPWESDFEEEFVFKQPLLDRNAEFKFRESKNLGIYTTRQWLELDQPILRVVHEFDGDWQFLTGDQMPEDIKLVCLEEIVKKDNSLNEVFDLEYGESAERDYINGLWTRTKIELDEG